MGTKIARLHRDPAVAEPTARPQIPDPEALPALGTWLERERRLRGLSREWLGARLKLAPSVLQAIESGEQPLRGDGHGRSTARALARAMGADPEMAVSLLRRAPPAHLPPTRQRRVFTGVALGTAVVAAALAAAVGLEALWSSLDEPTRGVPSPPERVYRTDYVARLLGGTAPGIETSRGLRDTPSRP